MGITTQLNWYGSERTKEIDKASRAGALKCGFAIERDAKTMCRVDTGRLRASISTNWSGSNKAFGKTGTKAFAADGITNPGGVGGKIFTVRVGTRVEYAPYVEFGTHRMDPRPFLFPAYELNKRHLADYIKGAYVAKSDIPSGGGSL